MQRCKLNYVFQYVLSTEMLKMSYFEENILICKSGMSIKWMNLSTFVTSQKHSFVNNVLKLSIGKEFC